MTLVFIQHNLLLYILPVRHRRLYVRIVPYPSILPALVRGRVSLNPADPADPLSSKTVHDAGLGAREGAVLIILRCTRASCRLHTDCDIIVSERLVRTGVRAVRKIGWS